MIKVDIISGFLGAGKTTLITKLLKEALVGQKTILIENEFGEVGVDASLLKGSGVITRELNSGCICCSLVGDFESSLKEVIETYSPERIIIEPSGVAKLSEIIAAVSAVNGKKTETDAALSINSATVVVDGTRCAMYLKNFGEFYIDQVQNAKTVVISRSKKLSLDKLQDAVDLIRTHNKMSPVITTDWDELDAKDMLSVMEGEDSFFDDALKEAHHGHTHEEHSDHEHDHTHEHHDHNHDHSHTHEHHSHSHDHHSHEHDHHNHNHDHDHSHHCHDPHCTHPDHDHHDADEIFTSVGIYTSDIYTTQFISELPEKFDHQSYGVILRAKGILQTDSGWISFDYVPGEHEIRPATADVTGRICVIGSKIDENSIRKLLKIKN